MEKIKLSDFSFCMFHSEFSGEPLIDINQLMVESFSGKELKQFVEFCINQLHENISKKINNNDSSFSDNKKLHELMVMHIISNHKQKNDWICVDDQLPNTELPIVMSGENISMFGYYYNGRFLDGINLNNEIKSITHWMPLPTR